MNWRSNWVWKVNKFSSSPRFSWVWRPFSLSATALIEINPLVITKQGDLICLDGKLGADGNALFRQPDLREMRDQSQEDHVKRRRRSGN